MVKKYYPWMIFLSFLLLLTCSASSYARVIDSILWPVRLGLIAGLSALFVWSRYRQRDAATKTTPHDSADHFLSAIRRWYYGDTKR
jgi:hypothetical protein